MARCAAASGSGGADATSAGLGYCVSVGRTGQLPKRAVMQIADLLVSEGVFTAIKAQSKKQVFQELATRAAPLVHMPEKRVFEIISEREKLGTTGVGQGIAIPHGRHPEIEKITGLFARLVPPAEYAAVDDQPVDLVFLLLAPEGAGADHLKALARVSRLLRSQTVCSKLRAAATAEELFAILTEPPPANTKTVAA